MKRVLIIAFALVMLCNGAFAQGGRPQGERPSREEMSKAQVKRLVKELALDNATAENFEVIYGLYREERSELMKKYPMFKGEMGPQGRRGEQRELPSDEEVEQKIMDGFKRERALVDLKEKYYQEFRKIMTPQQIQKMYMLESMPRGMQGGGYPQGGPGGYPGGGYPGGGFPGGGMMPPGNW